ncbi:DUF3346 domain-containing protein [Vibrio chagasii]|nr:DUF3346 domain-containing protein [Vibrio chagasii]
MEEVLRYSRARTTFNAGKVVIWHRR